MAVEPAPGSNGVIEVRISDLSQLFNTLDPFPFPERDLDKDAEEFIVGWARELPRHQPLRILIHLPGTEVAKHDAKQLRDAMNRYFEYRASVIGRDIKELFRVGRYSLLIGLCVLALGLIAARLISASMDPTPFQRFLQEGFIIASWVANWKPIEIFLYDWWPLVRRRNLYRRLAAAAVDLRPY